MSCQSSNVECLIASGVAGARRRRRGMLNPPHGFTVGCTCGNDLCVEPEHLILRKWNSYGGRFTEYAARIAALKMDESIDLPEIADAADFYVNVRSAACMNLVKFIVRTIPSGGIRVIRMGEWYGEVSSKHYPVLAHRQAAPCNSLRPGGFFLGFMSYSSLHRRDIPKYQHCQAKGCAFPANGNGEALCRHHFHFFDYSVSRLGRNLDMEDIYGTDKQAPRFYVSWFWKHNSERLKFQQGGNTSWWQERVQKIIGERIAAKVDKRCTEKRVYATKAEADVIVREMKAENRARSAISLHSYLCDSCQKWHVGNANTVFAAMERAPVRMGASVPGLHRGVAGLHRGAKPNRRIGNGKASQSNKRRKAAAVNRVGNKRTPHDPEKRWTREQLEEQANIILAENGFFSELHNSAVDTCARKIEYKTADSARAALRNIQHRGRGKRLEVYRCTNCSNWHLGNPWSPSFILSPEYETSEAAYEVIEPDFTEAQERAELISDINTKEFEEIFAEE